MKSVCLCAFLSVVFIFSFGDAADSPVIRQALVDLYQATQGQYWIRQRNWLTNTSYCTWQNVGCNGTTISLDLRANDLVGTIPNSIGTLGPNISSLLMDINRLSGTIPASLTNITNIKQLDISQNTLTGSIPTGFGALKQIQLFWLNDNLLVGAIPVDLMDILPYVVKFQDTQGCRLQGNSFCCPVPAWVPPECGMTCNITDYCIEKQKRATIIF